MTIRKIATHALAAGAVTVTLLQGAGSATAQSVTIVVPFAAGGGTDITTRSMQEEMSKSLGTNVVVKNTAGAGGTIGVAAAARARPDGRTIAMAPVGPLTTQTHLRKLPYSVDSFEYVCLAYSAPTAIAVSKDSEFETLDDLVAHAKENPGDLNFAVQAIGSIPHVAGLALADAAGIEMTFLPVDGDGPALKALLDGTADLFIPHVSFLSNNSDQIRSLAILKEGRLETMPDEVTAMELGYDLDIPIWGGLVAPKGTPQEQITALETACEQAISSEPFQERMEQLQQPPAYMNGADFEAFVKTQFERNHGLLEQAGLLAE